MEETKKTNKNRGAFSLCQGFAAKNEAGSRCVGTRAETSLKFWAHHFSRTFFFCLSVCLSVCLSLFSLDCCSPGLIRLASPPLLLAQEYVVHIWHLGKVRLHSDFAVRCPSPMTPLTFFLALQWRYPSNQVCFGFEGGGTFCYLLLLLGVNGCFLLLPADRWW